MKYLIGGLGNIGSEYAGTRHNAGFMIADALAATAGATFSTERYGDIAHMRVKNAQITILKPSTYMNLSGNAVRYWKDKEGIETENILVLVDDCALEPYASSHPEAMPDTTDLRTLPRCSALRHMHACVSA